ncbi:MAG: apolipoprotein N-acyltransferase, partial [Actinomycetota bacterium]
HPESYAKRSRRVALDHVRLTFELADGNRPDLVVWPENALDVDPLHHAALRESITGVIQAVNAPLMAGAVVRGRDGRYRNQLLYYSSSGRVVGRYSKMHLVPFAEYVPYRPVLGWVQSLRTVHRELVPGDGIRLFDVHGVAVGTPICFENTFPGLVRRFVNAGAGILVVTTNDSSFGTSPASREHVIMSELRAVENGRWVVQAAVSGISAIIDPHGNVLKRTPMFSPAILRARVPSSTATTFYTRTGDWFPWLAGAVAASILVALLLKRRRSTTA